jgi:hypothetical protein
MQIGKWVAACAALVVVAGCHNSGYDQNTAQLRALNAVVDAEPLDVLVDDGVKATAVSLGNASSYTEINSGTRDVKVRSDTTQTVLSDKSTGFTSGTNVTLLIYGKRNAVQTAVLTDDTTTITSGRAHVRVVNLAPDTGGVDLYVGNGDISSLPATISGAAYTGVTSPAEVVPGSYQLTITTAGTRDVLFQSDPQAVAAGAVVNVVVVPALGGKLVNVTLLAQGVGGTSTTLVNSLARVKAVNAIADSSGVNFRADGAPVLLNVPYGAASSYVTLAQGGHALQIEASNVPGVAIASQTRAFDAARDYSVIAAGATAAAQLVVLADDNSLPAAGLARVRFVNAMPGPASADVQLNFASQVSQLPYGAASSYYSIAPSTTYTITFTSPGGLSVLATLSPAELDAGAVYTAYLVGTAGAAQARLVRDR